MPHANNTSDVRRAVKQKQTANARARAHGNRKENKAEKTKVQRHYHAEWTPETSLPIVAKIMENEQIVTSSFIRFLLKSKKVSVKITTEGHLNGEVVHISPEGFFDSQGNQFPIEIYSITVPTGNGYGFHFRMNPKVKKIFVS